MKPTAEERNTFGKLTSANPARLQWSSISAILITMPQENHVFGLQLILMVIELNTLSSQATFAGLWYLSYLTTQPMQLAEKTPVLIEQLSHTTRQRSTFSHISQSIQGLLVKGLCRCLFQTQAAKKGIELLSMDPALNK